jgi:hypothetical protein
MLPPKLCVVRDISWVPWSPENAQTDFDLELSIDFVNLDDPLDRARIVLPALGERDRATRRDEHGLERVPTARSATFTWSRQSTQA